MRPRGSPNRTGRRSERIVLRKQSDASQVAAGGSLGSGTGAGSVWRARAIASARRAALRRLRSRSISVVTSQTLRRSAPDGGAIRHAYVAINGSQHEAADARDVAIRSILVTRW